MTAFANLTNAALEFIDDRLKVIDENAFNDYTPEDRASLLREQALIEQEIEHLTQLIHAAQTIANMQHPSIEQLHRQRGFAHEADCVAELVRAVAIISKFSNSALGTPDSQAP